MDQISRAPRSECFANQRRIGIEFSEQLRGEIVDLVWLEIDDEIDIERCPRDAMSRTGNGASDLVGNFHPVQNFEQAGKCLNGCGHPAPDPSHRRGS